MCQIKNFFTTHAPQVKYLVGASVEMTNTNPLKDKIIGIALLKYDVNTMKCVDKLVTNVNPDGANISINALLYCGRTLKEVECAPKFIDIADRVTDIVGGEETAIIGYNLRSLTVPFIYNECSRCAKHIDFSENVNKTVIDIKDFQEQTGVYFFNMETMAKACNLFNPTEYGISFNTMTGQAKGSVIILEKMLEKGTKPELLPIYDNGNLVAYKKMHDTAISELNGTIQLVFPVGKYYGVPVEFVQKTDPGYIEWCLSNSSGFSTVVKQKFKERLGIIS